MTTEHQFVKSILKAVKSYEGVPRRCCMITNKMMQRLIDTADQISIQSSARAIVDWILRDCLQCYKSGLLNLPALSEAWNESL